MRSIFASLCFNALFLRGDGARGLEDEAPQEIGACMRNVAHQKYHKINGVVGQDAPLGMD